MNLNRHVVTPAFLLSLALAFPARAVDTPVISQWLVTSAKATGAKLENFVSSLRLVNGTASSATVDITFYPRVNFDRTLGQAPGDNSVNAVKATVTVPAGQTLAVDDVLNSLFGVTATNASGGLKVESRNFVPISVLSQTLVTNAKAADGTPGTYGFAIPGQVPDNAVAVGDTGYVPYLSSSPTTTQGYRSNLFLQTTNSGGNTVVTVTLLNGADGSTIGTRDVTLGTLVQTQINNIADFLGYSGVNTNLTAVITVKSGGPVFTGASVNDNATGSQIYAPPTKKWSPRYASFGLILGDGGYGFSGRLDIKADGVADFLTAAPVIDTCGSSGPAVFIFQASSAPPISNTSFTLNADGSTSFSGGDTESNWTGAFGVNADGSVQGNLTYTRASGSAGNPCPGGTVTVPFFGRKILAYGIY
jgi:hypothetical protein